MSFLKSSVSDNGEQNRGGYMRGSVSALALGSVGFIILSTMFPIHPKFVSSTPPLATDVSTTPIITSTPAVTAPSTAFDSTSPTPFLGGAPVTLGGGSATTENGLAASEVVVGSTLESNISSPSIRTPTVGATSSGALITTNLTSQGGAPTLPGGSRPTLLGESQTNGNVNITGLDVSTARPNTGGFGETTQSIVAPSVNGSIQAPAQAATDASTTSLNILSNGAFERNAQLFTDTRSRPLFSIILHVETIEQAAAAAGLAASVTLAVDAENPDAAKIATAYRQLGGETLLSMPATGNLRLVEEDNAEFVASKLTALLPEELNVIGIIDVSGSSFPDTPESANSIVSALALTGHAVVTSSDIDQPHTAFLAANSVGLPAVNFSTSLMDFADSGAKTDEINRIVRGLDRSSSTVIYGTADTETLATLNSWLAGSQAGGVTMAPLSASIKR